MAAYVQQQLIMSHLRVGNEETILFTNGERFKKFQISLYQNQPLCEKTHQPRPGHFLL